MYVNESDRTRCQDCHQLEKIEEMIPVDNLENIFSYLDYASMQSTVIVSRRWQKEALSTTFSIVRNFAQFLGANLQNEYINEKKQLSIIETDTNISDPANRTVNSSIHGLRGKILNILKNLKARHLVLIEDMITPIFFNKIFDITRIYVEIGEANKMNDWSKKCDVSLNISEKLKVLLRLPEEIGECIEIADTIPAENHRSSALKDISDILVEKNDIGRAIAVANKIPDEMNKGLAFYEISKRLLDVYEEIDGAIEIANSITLADTKGRALLNIFNALIKKNEIDIEIANTIFESGAVAWVETSNAILKLVDDALGNHNIVMAEEIANKVSHKRTKGESLKKISKFLIEKGFTDKAIGVANAISCATLKASAFETISKTLVERNDIDKAIEVANILINFATTISDPEINKNISEALRAISKALIGKDIDKAIEIANKIPKEDIKSSVLRLISEALKKINNIDKAIKIVRTIPSAQAFHKKMALGAIVKKLMKVNNFDEIIKHSIEIIEIIKTIPSTDCSSICSTISYKFEEISRKLIQSGDIPKAKEIANIIPDRYSKESALENISKAEKKNTD